MVDGGRGGTEGAEEGTDTPMSLVVIISSSPETWRQCSEPGRHDVCPAPLQPGRSPLLSVHWQMNFWLCH